MTANSVVEVRTGLAGQGYLADEGLATALFLAERLERPLLLEGEAGVGKTEVAKALAAWRGAELIRLQCYEGIDVSQAVYEWDYARQLIHLRAAAEGSGGVPLAEDELFSERFLVRRPLLRAIAGHTPGCPSTTALTDPFQPPVLLVDEIDRADDEFEAFLLEVLSEYAVTVPELGTFRADRPPAVIITSNRTREVHDALKRRCLYHWLELPGLEREIAIVRLRAPEVDAVLAEQVTAAVRRLRAMDLYKPPGVAETIDWAKSLHVLGYDGIDEHALELTVGSILKYREDAERALANSAELLESVGDAR